MGFRSTFVTEDLFPDAFWPTWFREKYVDSVNIGACLSSKMECKTYYTWKDLDADICRVLAEAPDDEYARPLRNVVLVYLHECGGITRVELSPAGPRYSEPESWREEFGVTHLSCYGCSDVDRARPS